MRYVAVLAFAAATSLSAASSTLAPRSGLQDGCVVGWFEVEPNPCVNWGPYDIYFRVWNGTDNAITVTRVTDDGSEVWSGSLTVPDHEVRNVHSAHGDHAQAGSYNHNPVFYTSAGTIYGPAYTFTVLSDGGCGWLQVEPNPCQAGEPYDVYFRFYNGTSGSIIVTRVTDSGSEVWNGNLSVPSGTTSIVHSAHGNAAQSGIWVHSPVVFETSAGSIQGPDYKFYVNTVAGVEEQSNLPNADGVDLTIAPSLAVGSADIHFTSDVRRRTKIEVLDIAGRPVKTVIDGVVTAGQHHVRWDRTNQSGQRVTAGVYICRLETAGRVATARVTITR